MLIPCSEIFCLVLVRVLWRNRTNRRLSIYLSSIVIDIYGQRFIIRNRPMWLWRPTSSKICSQQAGDIGEHMVYSSSKKAIRLETLNPGTASVSFWVWKQGKNPVSQFKGSEAGGVPSYLGKVSLLFYLGLQLIRQGPPTLGRTISFTQFIDLNVINSSKNIFIKPHRILFDQMSAHPVTQSSLHVKLTVTFPLPFTSPFCLRFFNSQIKNRAAHHDHSVDLTLSPLLNLS